MGSGIETKNNTHACAEHFFIAVELCINNRMTKRMAMVMARGFSKQGMADAAEGCTHYTLMLCGRKVGD